MDAPRWDLNSIYPGIASEKFAADLVALEAHIVQLEELIAACEPTRAWCEDVIILYAEMRSYAAELANYAQVCYTVETQNPAILAAVDKVEAFGPKLNTIGVMLASAFASIEDSLEALKAESELLASHAYFIEKLLLDHKHLMSSAEEALAADLGRSGANAWSRLQETLIAGTSIAWGEADEEPSFGESKTINELRSMAMDPDRAVRKKAFYHEVELLRRHESAYAAALNGVKGSVLTLEKRREIPDFLFNSIRDSGLNRDILEALIASLEDARDFFSRYFKTKAKLLGVEKLDFCDLFAPLSSGVGGAREGGNSASANSVGDNRASGNSAGDTRSPSGSEVDKVWTPEEACDYVEKQFGAFHKPMGEFVRMAFDKNWVDFPIQKGKVGGAYCMDFIRAKETRVLLNFDGTFSSVATLAHEMGHAYHGWVAKDVPVLLGDTPMTLAETASIFAETIVTEEALREVAPEARLALLEQSLQSSSQVIIDILSRYYFEYSAFERRANGELSAKDFSELMLAAQRKAYGDSLAELHPYMWAVKGHYYIPELSFYNYPYAFGLLFGLGLYQISREKPESFGALYDDVLAHTGAMPAADVAARAGLDITTKEFWKASLAQLEKQISEFEELAK